MNATYFDTPNAAVATNFKAGSSTLARAIIKAHYPEIESVLTTPHGDGNGTAYPEGKSADNVRWHGMSPKLDDPKDRPITLLAVRDPVEKFRSACVESKVADVDAKLTSLEVDGFTLNAHFWPQSRLLQGNLVKLYRFPQDLDALATEAGLSLPLPNIDGGNAPEKKPTLTPEQLSRVQAIYADDIALYESITEAGQTYTPPVIPPTEAELQTQAIEGAHAASAAAFDSLPAGKRALWEPVRSAVQKAIRAGDFAEAVEVIETVPNLYSGMAADRKLFLNLFDV